VRASARTSGVLAVLAAWLMMAGPAEAQGPGPAPGRTYKVGFSQIVDHPALNETRRGFLDGLRQAGFVEGRNLVFLYQNAQGDVANARNIAEKFLADGVDLLAPCTTPNAQAAVKVARGGKTPVVFGCVTDPVAAGILERVDGPSGTNVTGLYNPLPIAELFDLFLRIQPGLHTAATIYNPSEANSVVINRRAKAEAERRGLRWVEVTVTSSAEVKTAAESVPGKVDAYVLGQDNTVASAFEAVVRVAAGARLPIFSMDPQSVPRGAVASLAANQYAQGVQWARELAAPILLGAPAETLAPVRPRAFDLQVNVAAATAAGLTVPPDVVERATRVFGR
jgi:putative ABC transport system substrate-binding protein